MGEILCAREVFAASSMHLASQMSMGRITWCRIRSWRHECGWGRVGQPVRRGGVYATSSAVWPHDELLAAKKAGMGLCGIEPAFRLMIAVSNSRKAAVEAMRRQPANEVVRCQQCRRMIHVASTSHGQNGLTVFLYNCAYE